MGLCQHFAEAALVDPLIFTYEYFDPSVHHLRGFLSEHQRTSASAPTRVPLDPTLLLLLSLTVLV